MKKGPKSPPTSMPPSLVALLVALDHPEAKKLTPPKDNPPLELRVGFTWGWAYRGQVVEARALALSPGLASHQLQALMALISVLADKEAEVEVDLAAARDLVDPALKDKDTGVTSWTLYRLVQLGARGGKSDLASKIAEQIPDPDVRGWAEMDTWRPNMDKQSDLDVLSNYAGQKPPCRHLLLFLARRLTKSKGSSAVSKAVDGWEPELRPLGYAGVALGMQDAKK